MSDRDSFIEEVAEEVRRDALVSSLRRYQWVIAAVLVVAIGAASANEWWKSSVAGAAQAAGDALTAALDVEDPVERIAALEPLTAADGPTAILAQFHLAASALDADDTARAMAAYRAVIEGAETPPLYADLARLNLVTAGQGDLSADERDRLIDALISGQGNFRNLALEQRVIALLSDGDVDAAAETLTILLRDSAVSGGLRVRAQQLMQSLGRELPEQSTGPDAG